MTLALISVDFIFGQMTAQKNNSKSMVNIFSNIDKTKITAYEFYSKLQEAISELTIELHNVSTLIKNDFIENEQLKSEGY